jgi:hypothetical protein
VKGKSDNGSEKRRKEEIVKPDPSPKSLNRVFVVQFCDLTESESARFGGRAEHVMSGQDTCFETPEELVAFFRRVMSQLKPRSQKDLRQ